MEEGDNSEEDNGLSGTPATPRLTRTGLSPSNNRTFHLQGQPEPRPLPCRLASHGSQQSGVGRERRTEEEDERWEEEEEVLYLKTGSWPTVTLESRTTSSETLPISQSSMKTSLAKIQSFRLLENV